MTNQRGTHRAMWLIGVAIAVLACGDGTGPADPLSGTYDLTTTLDSFYFETGAPDPPDCPANGSGFPYCSHVRAESRATLSGSFVVADKRQAGADGTELLLTTGEIQGSFCLAFNGQSGCTTFEPKHIVYPIGLFVPDPSEPVIELDQSESSDAYRIVLTPKVITADSITGRVYWEAYSGRRPPAHTGRFVAKKRH